MLKLNSSTTSKLLNGIKSNFPRNLRRPNFTSVNRVRNSSSLSGGAEQENDQRRKLTTELKNAMKSKNSFASTTIRSVLSEVYSADKSPSGPISSSQITSILRKAIARRNDSASQYIAASRPELAENEKREVELLTSFLPPSMEESKIDEILTKLAEEQNFFAPGTEPKRVVGLLLKTFFAQVDKSLVDSKLVQERARGILEARQ